MNSTPAGEPFTGVTKIEGLKTGDGRKAINYVQPNSDELKLFQDFGYDYVIRHNGDIVENPYGVREVNNQDVFDVSYPPGHFLPREGVPVRWDYDGPVIGHGTVKEDGTFEFEITDQELYDRIMQPELRAVSIHHNPDNPYTRVEIDHRQPNFD